ISKCYPAERHISRGLDADCGCGSPHNPVRHLTWQRARTNSAEVVAKRAAEDSHALASTLEYAQRGWCPHADAADDAACRQIAALPKMVGCNHHGDGDCNLRGYQWRLACRGRQHQQSAQLRTNKLHERRD